MKIEGLREEIFGETDKGLSSLTVTGWVTLGDYEPLIKRLRRLSNDLEILKDYLGVDIVDTYSTRKLVKLKKTRKKSKKKR